MRPPLEVQVTECGGCNGWGIVIGGVDKASGERKVREHLECGGRGIFIRRFRRSDGGTGDHLDFPRDRTMPGMRGDDRRASLHGMSKADPLPSLVPVDGGGQRPGDGPGTTDLRFMRVQ
jgi:hypothetical protein